MTEAAASNVASFSNICPFCDEKMNSQFVLGKHLLAVHNICVNTSLNNNEDIEKEPMCFNATADSDSLTLGNKMKTLKYILNENFPKYIEELKFWINCEISRTEFDESVRPFFYDETIVIHNEFLICFLKEIRSINRSSINIIKERSNFASPLVIPPVELPPSDEAPQLPHLYLDKIISEKLKDMPMKKTLPDDETLYALTLVHSWENQCTTVNRKVVPVLQSTAMSIIKNIRDTVIARRKCLKVRLDGSIYDASKGDLKDVNPEDKFKYTGAFDAVEIADALKEEASLSSVKHLSKVVSKIINNEKSREH